MKSRYDRPDIGESPDYCEGLEPFDLGEIMDERELCYVCSLKWHGVDTVCSLHDIPEYDPRCIYCNGPIAALDDYEPYCSQQCSVWAELDSLEDN